MMQLTVFIVVLPFIACGSSQYERIADVSHVSKHHTRTPENNLAMEVDSAGSIGLMRKHSSEAKSFEDVYDTGDSDKSVTSQLEDPNSGYEEIGSGIAADTDLEDDEEAEVAAFLDSSQVKKVDDYRQRRLMWSTLMSLAKRKQAIGQEIHFLNQTGDLSNDLLFDRKSQVQQISSQMQKLHTGLGIRTGVTRISGHEWVARIVENLKKAEGPHGQEWRACRIMLKSVTNAEDPTQDFDNVLAKLKPKCDEKKTSSAHPEPIDCDLLERQMKLQATLLGLEPLRTKDGFCAVLVDAALPVTDEPACLRLMEDISHEFAVQNKGVVVPWPHILNQGAKFDNAFSAACDLEQHALPGAESCSVRLHGVKQVHANQTYKKLADLLTNLCPAFGMPLTRAHMQLRESHTSLLTSRAKLREEFRKAAHKAHGEEYKFTQRQMTRMGQGACCDRRAYVIEQGVSMSAVITLGASQSVGFGFAQENGGTCKHSTGDFVSGSVGLNIGLEIPDPDIGFSVALGFMYDYDDIAGHSYSEGWEFCFFFCVAGGRLYAAPAGNQIGEYVEISLSVGAMPDLGVGRTVAYTYTSQRSRRDDNYQFSECNRRRRNCFPGNAGVQTAWGPKQMSDLKVGDKVLAVNKHGKPFFDDVYFFGHADPREELTYTVLELPMNTIRMTSRHFIPKCRLDSHPCNWHDRVHAYADSIIVGDYVWALSVPNHTNLVPQRVQAVYKVIDNGAYNPYTLSGTIIVNGAVASSHSDWIFDDITPASLSQYLPFVYQAIFLPGRWLYNLVGTSAANVLDVNNPQKSPESHGNGPCFLVVCLAVLVGSVWASLSATIDSWKGDRRAWLGSLKQ